MTETKVLMCVFGIGQEILIIWAKMLTDYSVSIVCLCHLLLGTF